MIHITDTEIKHYNLERIPFMLKSRTPITELKENDNYHKSICFVQNPSCC